MAPEKPMPDKDPYWCPVCDRKGPGATHRSIQSHIVAMSDDPHDWDALRDEVASQAESQQTEGTPDSQEVNGEATESTEIQQNGSPETESQQSQRGTTPGEATDEATEANAEHAESTETQQNGGPDMATNEDYQRQQQSQSDGDSEGTESTESTGFSLPKLSTPMVLMVVVVCVVLLVVLIRSDDEHP